MDRQRSSKNDQSARFKYDEVLSRAPAAAMNTRLLSPCAVLLAVTTLLAFNAQGEDDEDRLPGWPQHFRLGMLIGFNIRAEFKMNISPTLPNMAGNPGTHG